MARIKPQALLLQSKKKKGPSRISATTIIIYILVAAVMVFFLFATYRSVLFRSMLQTDVGKGEALFAGQRKSDVAKYALISTTKGLVTVELYKDGSPEVVEEFIDLCTKGHFNGMQFNRVIKNFVIHGSKEERPETTEDWTSRVKNYAHLDTSLKHEAFMLGTSKAKHDGRGFDIFITTAPIPDLNDKINVFGRVIKGEDVVQEIEEVDTDNHYRPKAAVKIKGITLKQNL
nr:peptidyl-prolyl cis-trans isomerase CYP21-4-like [Ipomoea batatas]